MLFANSTMDLKIKLLEWPEGGNYLIVITRGLINAEGFERIFGKVAETSQALLDCRFLIDLEEATLTVEPLDIHLLVNGLGTDLRRHNNKIALVSSTDADDSARLRALSDSLRSLGLQIAVFDDARGAVAWLSDPL
jgi:hypothetical protein